MRALARESIHLGDLDTQLVTLSQLDSALALGIRGAILREIPPGAQGPSAAERMRLEVALTGIRKALTHDEISNLVVDEIVSRPGAAYLGEVAVFLRSKSAGRLRAGFTYLRSPGGQKAFSDFLAGLATHPPEPLHLQRVQQLLTGGREVELALVFSHDAVRAAMAAVAPQLPTILRREMPEWEQRHATERDTFRDSLQRTLTLQTYYVLYALSDDDVDAVLRFWRSAPGKWWSSTRIEVSTAVMRARLSAAASLLAPSHGDAPALAPAH
ncbi:MAG: hypothetical protein ACO3JL_15285 [Myxococcota bacterium]